MNMRTVLPGKARQIEECTGFVMETLESCGLRPSVVPAESGIGVVVRCPMSFLVCYRFDIFETEDDLVVESVAGDITIMDDSKNSRSGLFDGFGGLAYRMFRYLMASPVIKTVHSDIERRFARCPSPA